MFYLIKYQVLGKFKRLIFSIFFLVLGLSVFTKCFHIYFFLNKKDSIFSFLDRGKGKEKERERNINVCLPLTCPLLWTWTATRAGALD